nr:MAG TPA: hypothetical protein [Caudoviricetes sp.]
MFCVHAQPPPVVRRHINMRPATNCPLPFGDLQIGGLQLTLCFGGGFVRT